MNKNMLDGLYICDLFQVDKEKGYLDKNELHWKYSIGLMLDDIYDYKVGSVIVKKSNLSKYNLKELLTGVSLDTLYERFNNAKSISTISHTVKGNKKEYHTFILVSSLNNKANLDDIYKYCKEHSDAKEYKRELLDLIDHGKENCDNKKIEEKAKQDAVNSIVLKKVL